MNEKREKLSVWLEFSPKGNLLNVRLSCQSDSSQRVLEKSLSRLFANGLRQRSRRANRDKR
jgi:hypothetical protein